MRQDAFLGLDIGGTGAKAGVYDAGGRPLGFGHATYQPVPLPHGHVEIPIADIERAARAAVRQAVRTSEARVRALAISSQGETFVSLDARGRPLHRAIVWYDARAQAEAKCLQRVMPDISAIAAAPKILWLRAHAPRIMARARRHLLLPDYFAWRLTGRAVTDPTTASSSGLYVDGETSYRSAALAAAGIPADFLAEIQPAGTPIARLQGGAARAWSLPADARLVTGTNDQYAGALGAGNSRPGILSVTTGTCLALVTLTRDPPRTVPPGLFVGGFPISPLFFLLAYAKTAGIVLDWFRREFCPGRTWAELERAARAVPPGSRGICVCPHFDGRISPAPDPRVRGAISGLALQHTAADIFRAMLESLCFVLRENVEFLEATGAPLRAIRAIGGGAKSDLLLQMMADVLGRTVERPRVTEAATLGAAMLAAFGAGRFPSLTAASQTLYRGGRRFRPQGKVHRAYMQLN